MKMSKIFWAAGLLIPVFGATAFGASNNNTVKNGRELAFIVCSTCHVVSADQDFAPALSNPGPAFHEIAHQSNTTAASLRIFLSTTHGRLNSVPAKMPDPMLMEYQKTEVIAYIMSLRRKP
jgi:cytochrome c